jgi:hypothetical protein
MLAGAQWLDLGRLRANRNSIMFGDIEMSNIKLGRFLILAILSALGLTAISAGSASAATEPGTFFIVNAKGELTILLSGITGTVLAPYLLVAGRNLKLGCTGGEVEPEGEGGAKSEITNATHALAVIIFKGCTTLNHKTNAELPCKVADILVIALALPVLIGPKANNDLGVLFEPDKTSKEGAEGRFATIKLTGETCPLPASNPVTGTVTALVDNNHTPEVLLLFSEAIQKESGDSILFGGFSAYLNGTAHITLTGEHLGLKFGVL